MWSRTTQPKRLVECECRLFLRFSSNRVGYIILFLGLTFTARTSSSGFCLWCPKQQQQQRRVVTALPTLAATSQLASLLPKRKPSQKPKPKPKTSTTPQAERPQRCLQVGAPSLLPQTPHSVRKLSTEQRVVRKKSAQFWRSQHLSEGCLEQRLEGAERQREREREEGVGAASSGKQRGGWWGGLK